MIWEAFKRDAFIITILVLIFIITYQAKMLVDERGAREEVKTVIHYYVDEDDNATLMKEIKIITGG